MSSAQHSVAFSAGLCIPGGGNTGTTPHILMMFSIPNLFLRGKTSNFCPPPAQDHWLPYELPSKGVRTFLSLSLSKVFGWEDNANNVVFMFDDVMLYCVHIV